MNRYMAHRRADAYETAVALRADIYQPRPNWRTHAECAASACPHAWFYSAELAYLGRKVCARCPVRIDCATATMRDEAGMDPASVHGYVGVSATVRARHHLRIRRAA